MPCGGAKPAPAVVLTLTVNPTGFPFTVTEAGVVVQLNPEGNCPLQLKVTVLAKPLTGVTCKL